MNSGSSSLTERLIGRFLLNAQGAAKQPDAREQRQKQGKATTDPDRAPGETKHLDQSASEAASQQQNT
ncbi:MAG TPA: hypothetical protein VK035_03135 [Kiloniellales bacterium]|nr:hypothetical protein [Kiloniellales bacterium]